jgi:hypothetical protein
MFAGKNFCTFAGFPAQSDQASCRLYANNLNCHVIASGREPHTPIFEAPLGGWVTLNALTPLAAAYLFGFGS